MLIALVISASFNFVLCLIILKSKLSKRADIDQISKALVDFEKHGGCLVKISRVNPNDVIIHPMGD